MRVSQTYIPVTAAFMLCAAFAAPTVAQDLDAGDCPGGVDGTDAFVVCDFQSGNIGKDGSTYTLSDDTWTGRNPTNTNPNSTPSDNSTYNSFFLYDVTELDPVSDEKTLVVTFFADDKNFTSNGDFTLELYQMSATSIGTVLDPSPTNTELMMAFSDLQSEPLYGSYTFEVDGSGNTSGTIGTFEISLSGVALDDFNDAINGNIDAYQDNGGVDGAYREIFGLGAHVDGSESGVRIVNISMVSPGSGIQAVPEVTATGALAAFGSLLAMMAFLWERRRAASSLTTWDGSIEKFEYK